MRIGFLGTGIMGSRMAANLIAHEYTLTVHNRTKEKTEDLIKLGAKWADSPANLAGDSDCVITMLAHPRAVESAALDAESGFLDTLQPGTLWIDCSTGNPAFARRMAHEAQLRNVRFLDAPVAGSKNQAQDAQLVFFVGGHAEDLQACEHILSAMGKQVRHVGAHGQGTALKLVINHLLATSMIAFAEGLVLGESMGLSQELLLNTLIGGPVTAPFLASKREKIAAGDYSAEFPLRWMQKDLQMVAETAFECGVAMPGSNAAKEIYQLAVQFGHGDDDLSAIYDFLRTTQ